LSKTKIYTGTVLVLGMVQFIESIAFSIPSSYYPNYVIELGASVASIGLFTSSFMIAEAIMAPKMGTFSDIYGRKRIIILGLFADIFVGALTGLAPSWYWLLIIRIINGAVTSAATISAEALLMDSVALDRRGEASGFVMSMARMGRSIGPLFGGIIQSVSYTGGLSLLNSYRVPYFADAGLAVVALLLVIWKVQDIKVNDPTTISVRETSSRVVKAHMSFSFKVLLVYSFVNGFSSGFIMPIMVLFYNDKFGIEPVEIGIILSISGFVGIFAGWVAGRFSDKAGRKPLIAVGSFLSRLCGFALPLTGDVTQAAGVLSVRSLGFNINGPAMRAPRADLTPTEDRGKYFGMFRTAMTSGDIVGPLIGTYLYDVYRLKNIEVAGLVLPGYGIPFFINSIMGIAATIMLLALVKETVHSDV